jgi:hypothetical protein
MLTLVTLLLSRKMNNNHKQLVVLGSINVDHLLNVHKFPQAGETVTGPTTNWHLVAKVQIKLLLQVVAEPTLNFSRA